MTGEDLRRAKLLEGLRRDVRGFTPELDLNGPGRAAAMASVVSRFGAILGESLDQLPVRSRLAFADFCADAIQPASSARVPLVLSVQPDAPENTVLPEGSRFAARLPPPSPTLGPEASAAAAQEAEFVTDERITLTRAAIASCYSVDPGADQYSDHLPGLLPEAATGAVLFHGMAQAPHDLYVGHNEHLALKGRAEVRVYLDVLASAGASRRPILLDWFYLSKDGWFPLTTVSDGTDRLARDGVVLLYKGCGPDAVEGEVGGHTSYWLRARVSDRRPSTRGRARATSEPAPGPGELYVEDGGVFLAGDVVTFDGTARAAVVRVAGGLVETSPELPDPPEGRSEATLTLADALPPLRPAGIDGAGQLPRVDMLRLSVGFEKGGLNPDLMAVDGQALDLDRPFLPLGRTPVPGTTLFVACDDAFARSGASVRLRSELEVPGAIWGAEPFVIFVEYWNGAAWVQLTAVDGVRGAEAFFLADGSTVEPELRFECPDDWEKLVIAGEERLWLRLRMMSGSFGQQTWETVSTGNSISVSPVQGSLQPPMMSRVVVSYQYTTERALPDSCVTYNDFVFEDRSFDVQWRRRPFYPFTPIRDQAPALHLGMTEKLPVGLNSLLVIVPEALATPSEEPRPFVFEYRSARGWSELAVVDGTEGFTSTGLLQFIGPGDVVATPGQGGDLYRFRARLKKGQRMRPLSISGLHLNGVWATQSAANRRATLGQSDGTAAQLFRAPPRTVPILPGVQVELREWTGRGSDWETGVAGVPDSNLRIVRDPVDGETPTEVWVRWTLRRHFAASGPDDRHLVLDPATGFLRTGDGVRGRIPPAGSLVTMTWRFGGLVAANVGPGAIREVRSSAPGLSRVTNPVAASGAAAEETQVRLLPRTAARFAHRGRAVRASDYAWMAREATPSLARAVARPVTGEDGAVLPGRVELVLVPQSLDPRPLPSQDLLARVRRHLEASMPAGLERGLRLVAPTYVSIAVVVRAELSGSVRAGEVEASLRMALSRYLHALSGGPEGDGWPFGATLYQSQIGALLAGVPGVRTLPLLRWMRDGVLASDSLRLSDDQLPSAGDHQITLMREGAK